jgi:hypothetical protein
MVVAHVATRVPVVRRSVMLDSLRTFITLLVVAHHAALAYHRYAPPPPSSLSAAPQAWPAFPIVDPQRWSGAELITGINDSFFMSLMFLVAGVVAWPSLVRKGSSQYLRDRAIRLGPPFAVSALLLAPLAYYPTYLTTSASGGGVGGFLAEWMSLGKWYAGPAWFLWVLFACGAVMAALSTWKPRWVTGLGALFGRLGDRPFRWVALLVAASAIAYVPMATLFDPSSWSHVGPFWIQTSRALHYLAYFLVGAGLGAFGDDRGLLARDGTLARRWPLWLGLALVAFAFGVAMVIAIVSSLGHGGPSLGLATLGNLAFVMACAGWSVAALSFFVRFAKRSNPIVASLSANAFGIYLLHYVCVSWLQYSLLAVPMSGGVKFLLVFVGAVAASWALSAMARRVPAIGRVIG